MRLTLAIVAFVFSMQGMLAQGNYVHEAPSLNQYDSLMLANLPEISAIAVLKSSDLPYYLDNSRLAYYRPIYQQISNECGQVSGVAYNFTYEINRLRDLPANEEANQYPPHFTFNFMSGGAGWFGVSYFHSFEILKALGCPNVETYGGMAAGGNSRWMSGYEDYLSAMSNRIREVYQIPVDTEEGLMTLKQWLHNHLDGSDVGGVASFYANSPWNMKTLPEGSPEEGKKVITYWAGNPTHAMTISGYNDSIRYDYNQDGLYTNNLDINGDGVLNMKDWEIGGLIFADGWQGGINFGDSGRCYMMYKTLADKLYEGGIWNNAVHILDVKSIEKPGLTAKIKMTYNRRMMLRIKCGVSSSANDTLPEHSISFPVFNFQGGNNYMQGGWELEENKTIEFGLDITALLGLLNPDSSKQFFLIIEERDPYSQGTGHIEHFSVIDHSGTYPQEYSCTEDSIPILDNGLTYASLLFEDELEVMAITTSELPAAVVGEAYNYQLESAGGNAPHKWSMRSATQESVIQAEIDTTGTFVEPDYYNYGNYAHTLPFSFPFYGTLVDTIYIHPKGLVMFENTNYPWPYLRDPELLIRNTRCIAPCLSKYMTILPDSGHGIWLSEDAEMLRIRWKGIVDDPFNAFPIEFGLNMHADGKVDFIFGSEMAGHQSIWSCGFSKGDNLNYYIPAIAESMLINEGDAIELQNIPLPEEMQITEDGLFSGTPEQYYKEVTLGFCLEDDDGCKAYRNIKFSATELDIDEKEFSDQSIHTYPNPFRNSITVLLTHPSGQPLTCMVYDIKGTLINTILEKESLNEGDMIQWDGRNEAGKTCPPGVYFIRLIAKDQAVSSKVIFTGN